jgi:hypothetical protein
MLSALDLTGVGGTKEFRTRHGRLFDSPAVRSGYGSVIGGTKMKKVTLLAGLASLGAFAAVLGAAPAMASDHEARDFWPDSKERSTSYTQAPEPGTLALLGLGLTGLGLTGLSRKRKK